jgi:hypothetical protein
MSPTFRSEDAYNEVGQDIRPPSLAEQEYWRSMTPGADEFHGVGQGGLSVSPPAGALPPRGRPAEHHQEKAA